MCVALLVLLTAAAIRLRETPPAPPGSAHHAKAWDLHASPDGMIFTWNRSAPELRHAARLGLIVHDGAAPRTHSLDRRTGTLIIPYTPRAAVMTIDGERVLLYGSEPRPPPLPERRAETKPILPQRSLKLPMLLSNRGNRVVSTAAVVLPRIPEYVRRPIDIELSIKVAPGGNVTSVASNYRHDPLRNRLSAVAADAVSKWAFDRIAVTSYREGKIRFLFTQRGISVEAAPA